MSRTCNQCNAVNPVEGKYCRKCGRQFALIEHVSLWKRSGEVHVVNDSDGSVRVTEFVIADIFSLKEVPFFLAPGRVEMFESKALRPPN